MLDFIIQEAAKYLLYRVIRDKHILFLIYNNMSKYMLSNWVENLQNNRYCQNFLCSLDNDYLQYQKLSNDANQNE